jgi:hypothetical protein
LRQSPRKNQPRNGLIFFFFEACFEAWAGVSLVQYISLLNDQKRKPIMKNKINLFVASLSKVNRQHIQLFFILLTLTMLVLGAGAPDDGGGIALK